MQACKQMIPLLILLGGMVAFFVLGAQSYLSMAMLKKHYMLLQQWTETYYILSVLVFVAAYTILAACSIPGAAVMSLLGGFLFGVWAGSVWVVLAATAGATITFMAVNTAFGRLMRQRAANTSGRLSRGLAGNAFNYLFFLRLVPICPFFVINIAAGLVGMSLRTFVLATFLGIIPGSVIYAWVGSTLGETIKRGEAIHTGIIYQPMILLPLLALAIMGLLPVAVRMIRRRLAP